MRRILFFALGLLLVVRAAAQKSEELGFFIGGANYIGDIKDIRFTDFSAPAMGAFYRLNFNPRVSGRVTFSTGKPMGSYLPTRIMDLAGQAEVTFYRFDLGNPNTWITPYMSGGAGVSYFGEPLISISFMSAAGLREKLSYAPSSSPTYSPFALNLAVGAGVKLAVNRHLGIGIDYQLRKLFSDDLDLLNLSSSIAGSAVSPTPVLSNALHNTDWVGFLGVHVFVRASMFIKEVPCPTFR